MVKCPQCSVSQYAAAPYVELPRCVACDTPLSRPKATSRSITKHMVDLARSASINRDSR
jgi:hypothetical protein